MREGVSQRHENFLMIWPWGSPRFWNSIQCMQYSSSPALGNMEFRVCSSNANFRLNTRTTMIGISAQDWPGRSCDWISGQSGLHVIVMKKVGLPKAAAMASESAICSLDQRFEPMNEEGK